MKKMPDELASFDGVSSTVDQFASRIRRKLREQQDREAEASRSASDRHAKLLQGVNFVRRALQETSKVALGEKFYLDVAVDESEGWPRVSLGLVDSLNPLNRDVALVVSAHDRKASGTIRFALRDGAVLGEVTLSDPGELARLPLVLKRAIRVFLDVTAAAMLERARGAGGGTIAEATPLLDDAPESPDVVTVPAPDLYVDQPSGEYANVMTPDDGGPGAGPIPLE